MAHCFSEHDARLRQEPGWRQVRLSFYDAIASVSRFVGAVGRLCGLALTLLITPLLAPLVGLADDLPLSERIDRLIESSQSAGQSLGPGRPTAIANDQDFVRRVYLDLAGRVPSLAEARAFLDDSAPGKRAALVDRLLASDDFSRHLATTLDVALMERRADKAVPSAEWRQFLYEAIAANKPYDQLVSELLAADGVEPSRRAAAKFLLDRDVEANSLTRDIGRVFFGRDMQCSQCHDHPLISDFVQEDYYGLQAFVSRSFLFTDKENKLFVGEKGEGQQQFASVFNKAKKGQTAPRLVDEAPVAEPEVAIGDEYEVPPADKVRPVPKYSRRGQLARLIASGTHRQFDRTLANRLWSMLFGRGIVEPLDLDHSENPPSHPELLDLLTVEIAARKYNYRAMLRELALSRAYQRSVDSPLDLLEQGHEAIHQAPQIEAEFARLKAGAEAATAAYKSAHALITEARTRAAAAGADCEKARAELAAAKRKATAAAAAQTAVAADLAAKQEIGKTLAEAAAKAAEAAAKLPTEAELAQAAEKFKARSAALSDELTKLTAALAEKQTATEAAQTAIAPLEAAFATARSAEAAILAEVSPLEAPFAETARAWKQARLQAQLASERVNDCRALAEYARLATAQPPAAPAMVQLAAEQATKRLERRFLVAGLKPLTPEQMAFAAMQSLGFLDQQLAAAEAEWTTKNAAPDGTMNDPAKLAAKPREVAQLAYGKAAAQVPTFVSLFGGGAGQPQQEFHATVDQSLFFANGGAIASWLEPGGGNLGEKMINAADPNAATEQLYLAIYSRRPSGDEAARASRILTEQAADKRTAVRQLIWSLLASAEFRFNH